MVFAIAPPQEVTEEQQVTSAADPACHSFPSTCHLVIGGGNSSVRNGDAGSPALLNRFATGKFFHPYRTATGLDTLSLLTTIVSPSIVALAGWKTLSSPQIANPTS